jgi:ribosomal protein S4
MAWDNQNRFKQDVEAYERQRWMENEVPKVAEHGEQLREARQASGYRARWRVAWAQVVGFLLAAAIVAGLVLFLVHR